MRKHSHRLVHCTELDPPHSKPQKERRGIQYDAERKISPKRDCIFDAMDEKKKKDYWEYLFSPMPRQVLRASGNGVEQCVPGGGGGSEVAPTAPVEVREGPTPPSARTHARQNGGRTRGSEWPRPNDANSGPVASRLSSCVPRRTASRGVSEHREQRRPLLQERYFATSRDIMSRCRVCSSFALVNQEPK